MEKDYQLLNYFHKNCSHADIVFKGDDDILLNPFKAAERIKNMTNDPTIKMSGCIKKGEHPNTHINLKYYVAPTLWELVLKLYNVNYHIPFGIDCQLPNMKMGTISQ